MLTSCGILDELLNVSVPWVPHLQNGDDNGLCILESLGGLNKVLNLTFFTHMLSFIPHKSSTRKVRQILA